MIHCNRKEEKLLRACSVLFGSHLSITLPFLDYIQLSGVKTAYRNRVKETHPDVITKRAASAAYTHDFLIVRESYEQLCHYLSQRNTLPSQPDDTACSNPKSTPSPNQHCSSPPWRQKMGPSLPARKLMFGEFLVYRGFCEWNEVMAALTGQRQKRPRLGKIGCDFGWITTQDIFTIFHHLRPGARFGETAVRIGLLTQQQLERLLRHQMIRQPKIGQVFLQNNLLSQKQLQEMLWHLSKHNFLVRSPQP